jgi:hypothetical protein
VVANVDAMLIMALIASGLTAGSLDPALNTLM